MRIIAGKYRSRQLRAPEGSAVRPTSDRLRETLFNILAPHLEGAVFLDVFAGSGAVGIEAISRGASQVYFIESAKRHANLIRENLKSLSIVDGFEVLEFDAAGALRRLDQDGVVANIVFLDPPYRDFRAYEQTLGLLSQSGIVASETLVIAEHDKHFDPGDAHGKLHRFRVLKQGDAVLSFYRNT